MSAWNIEDIREAIERIDYNAIDDAKSLDEAKVGVFLELMHVKSALETIADYLEERTA